MAWRRPFLLHGLAPPLPPPGKEQQVAAAGTLLQISMLVMIFRRPPCVPPLLRLSNGVTPARFLWILSTAASPCCFVLFWAESSVGRRLFVIFSGWHSRRQASSQAAACSLQEALQNVS
ncbi:hypothetical protein EJB05_56043, partial [Eragrostis curvula]